MKLQISIIGCGWLGLPLAKYLITKGYLVKGSTTSQNKLKVLRNVSIKSFFIQLNEAGLSGDYSAFLEGSDTIIINIPPGLRKDTSKNHVAEIMHLISAIEEQQIKNVLYISSTSVFKDEEDFPVIDHNSLPNATSNSAQQLIEIEQMLKENSSFKTTILRFGGLFDEKRHPAKYLSGRVNITNPEAPINLIHKADCIQIIFKIIENNIWNASFNAVYPEHPSKKLYYSSYCKKHDLALPEFISDRKSKGKIIDSSNLVQLLKHTFQQAP